MAIGRQTARGPQTPPFIFRAKKGVAEWGGMIPDADADAGAVPEFRPRFLANTRRRGGGYVPRGGQAKLNSTALDTTSDVAAIRGLIDFEVSSRRSLYYVGDGCPSLGASLPGQNISWVDHEQSPFLQNGVYYDSASKSSIICEYGEDLYTSLDKSLRLFVLVNTRWGQSALGISGSSQDIPLISLPTAFTQFSAGQQFDGYLFLGCDGGVGASKVIYWNGIGEKDSALTTIDAPSRFGVYREKLILGYGAASALNHIRVLSAGAPAGAWATVAPGAGTATFYRGVSYRDLFYFTTGQDYIYSFDGSALTQITRATMGITAASITRAIGVMDGYLFVGYKDGATAKMARFDGTTWVGTHKNFTTQVAAARDPHQMAAYRGDLVVAVEEAGTPNSTYLWTSPGSTTTGTYTRVQAGSVNDLLVH